MNEFHCIGTICFDPEMRTFQSGGRKVVLRLAINKVFKKNDGTTGKRTTFVDAEAWDSAADFICERFRKGDSIVLENASLEQDTWEKDGEKKQKHYLRINKFSFAPRGKKNEDEAPAQARRERSNQSVGREQEDLMPVTGDDDSSIPF